MSMGHVPDANIILFYSIKESKLPNVCSRVRTSFEKLFYKYVPTLLVRFTVIVLCIFVKWKVLKQALYGILLTKSSSLFSPHFAYVGLTAPLILRGSYRLCS